MAVSPCCNFFSPFASLPSCPTLGELRDRTVSSALIAFRFLAAGALVAGSSFVALSGWEGIAIVGGSYLILACARYFLVRTLQRIPALDLAVRVSLWGTLILGGVAMGGAAGLLLQGSSLLSTGLQTKAILTIFQALGVFTGTLGYIMPGAAPLLSYPFSNQSYNQRYEEKWEEMAQRGVARGMLLDGGAQPALAGQLIDWDVLMQTTSGYLPDQTDQLESLFIQHAPSRSDKELSDLIESCPTVFTLDFLKIHLSPQRWKSLVENRLDPALENLARIKLEFESLKGRLASIESDPSLYQNIEELFRDLQGEGDDIRKFLNYLKESASHEDFGFLNEIAKTALREQETLAAAMLKALQQIAMLEEKDEEIQAYEVLGEVGICIEDFRKLGVLLSLPDEEKLKNNPIGYVQETLKLHKLATKADLEQAGILKIIQDNKNLKGEELNELIIEHLVVLCGGKIPLLSSSTLSGEPSSFRGALIASAMNRWTSILPTIQTVFNRALAATLLTMQVVYHPEATALGFVFGLVASFSGTLVDLAKRFPLSWINMHSIYARETELDFRNKTFSENMQGLYWRISSLTCTIFFGKAGAFFAGMRHAYALREGVVHFRGGLAR